MGAESEKRPSRGVLDRPMDSGSDERFTSTGGAKGKAAAGERDGEGGRGKKTWCVGDRSAEDAARRCRELLDEDEEVAVGDGIEEDKVVALAAICSASNNDDNTPVSEGDGSLGLRCLRATLL
jgi:hypothetical protein